MAQERPELVDQAGHTSVVTSVAFGPDGQTAISESLDTRMKPWDLRDDAELATLTSFIDGSWAVAKRGGRYDSSNNGENPILSSLTGH